MKPILLFLYGCLVLALYGCPYESNYALDESAQLPIDEKLIGKWAAFAPKPSTEQHYKEDPVKVIFSKHSDNEYDIAITGYIDELIPYKVVTNDSIKGTAFLSSVANRSFLNAFIRGRVYFAEVKWEKGGLSILPLAERFTAIFPKKSKDLRIAVEQHYKIRSTPLYDEYFVLRNLQRVN